MSKTNKYPKIRRELKDRQAASQAIRAKINQTSDQERYDLWDEKREYGAVTRDLLLAYALLRGVPYCAVESKCREDNAPHPPDIQVMAAKFCHELDRGDIHDWLTAAAAKQEAA